MQPKIGCIRKEAQHAPNTPERLSALPRIWCCSLACYTLIDECGFNLGVQRFTVVDNSAFSPTGLTMPLDPVYPSFNSSFRPFPSREDPDASPGVLPPALPAPCIGYLGHPFKNKPFETEKGILSLV